MKLDKLLFVLLKTAVNVLFIEAPVEIGSSSVSSLAISIFLSIYYACDVDFDRTFFGQFFLD